MKAIFVDKNEDLYMFWKFFSAFSMCLFIPLAIWFKSSKKVNHEYNLNKYSAIWNLTKAAFLTYLANLFVHTGISGYLNPNEISNVPIHSDLKISMAIFCVYSSFNFLESIIKLILGRVTSLSSHVREFLITACFWLGFLLHGKVVCNIAIVHIFLQIFKESLACIKISTNSKTAKHLSALIGISQIIFGIYIYTIAISYIDFSSQAIYYSITLSIIIYTVSLFLACQEHIELFYKKLRPGMCTFLLFMHTCAIIGMYKFYHCQKAYTLLFEVYIFYVLSGLGITVGAHRLWSHRSYQASFPFRCILMILNSIANQGTIYHWARDHRVHHKYSEKEPDPYNSSYGFFYSHMGWLLLKKREPVIKAGREICCADLLEDPLVTFQKRWDPWWNQFWSFYVPALYGYLVHNDFWLGFFVHGALRWILCLHATWTVNSVAHLWGDRPYNPNISPAESLFTSLVANGEGWHNWHHQYPSDYATSEGGVFKHWNPSKLVIDIGAYFGHVWDRKRALDCWERAKKRRIEMESRSVERISSNSRNKIPSFKQSLPTHCTKKSLLRSIMNLIRDLMICITIACLAIIIKESPVGDFCSENFLINQLVNFVLWTIYALAQGTVAFGVWVLGYEAAGGRFSDYKIINHTVGIILHSSLMIPYSPRRADCKREKERASLMKSLSENAWSIFKIPSWNAWHFGFFSALATFCLYSLWAYHMGIFHFAKWYGGPWIILNCWLCIYLWLMENGPQEAMDGVVEENTLEMFTAGWLQSTWQKATRGHKYPWSRLVDHLHHHLPLCHIVHAVDFNVPHYHVKEAFKRLGELLEEFQQEIQEAQNQLLKASIEGSCTGSMISAVSQTNFKNS